MKRKRWAKLKEWQHPPSIFSIESLPQSWHLTLELAILASYKMLHLKIILHQNKLICNAE